MKKNIYAIYDKQVGVYMNPLHFITDAEAIRWFTTAVNDDKQPTNINLYPHQFILFNLGSFDDQTGYVESNPKELIHGNSVQEEKKQYTIEDMIKLMQDRQNKGGLN